MDDVTLDAVADIYAIVVDAGSQKVVVDIKGILDKHEYERSGCCYWRL